MKNKDPPQEISDIRKFMSTVKNGAIFMHKNEDRPERKR